MPWSRKLCAWEELRNNAFGKSTNAMRGLGLDLFINSRSLSHECVDESLEILVSSNADLASDGHVGTSM